jgi:carboxyl-terminal processing protease
MKGKWIMNSKSRVPAYLGLIALVLTACATKSIATQPPQSPQEYLSNTLDWIETNSIKIDTVDWATVREQALALAPNPQTTADTYPAIKFVLKQLDDSTTTFFPPDYLNETLIDPGFDAYYPEAVILNVYPGRPAAKAGLHVGDVIVALDGKPPVPYLGTQYVDTFGKTTYTVTVRRTGYDQPITVTIKQAAFDDLLQQPTGRRISTDQGNIGYIQLLATGGWDQYPTIAQEVIRKTDRAGTCGWIVDLRRNNSGDLWSYIAALGPILGEGEVGAFVQRDGLRYPWSYRDGKVYWDRVERSEDLVEGQLYKLRHPMPPVAVLISRATIAAGELAVVTFQGRSKVRTFGEATGGSPFLQIHTGLSDGAFLSVSGAYSQDRAGRIYKGPILPDETVTTDWEKFGTDQDPVILAAQSWLFSQPDCTQK